VFVNRFVEFPSFFFVFCFFFSGFVFCFVSSFWGFFVGDVCLSSSVSCG
jgi:hypothetical protein